MTALNWRKAQLTGKPARSVKDDEEFRGRDAAARWIERREKQTQKKPRGRK